MTNERLAAFLEHVRQNPDLQARISKAADVAELVAIASDADFVLTAECFDEVIDRELSADEMEAVAGGARPPRPHPGCVFSKVYSVWGCDDPPDADDVAVSSSNQR